MLAYVTDFAINQMGGREAIRGKAAEFAKDAAGGLIESTIRGAGGPEAARQRVVEFANESINGFLASESGINLVRTARKEINGRVLFVGAIGITLLLAGSSGLIGPIMRGDLSRLGPLEVVSIATPMTIGVATAGISANCWTTEGQIREKIRTGVNSLAQSQAEALIR